MESMNAYMSWINKFPLLTREEEVELTLKKNKGDSLARQKLIESNLRLVVKMAHGWTGRGVPLQDLVSEGNIGLMKGIDNYDYVPGAKLSSYVAWDIKKGMRNTIIDQSRTIRVTEDGFAKLNKITEAEKFLTDKLERDPTLDEVSAYTNLSSRTIRELKNSAQKTISLDDRVNSDLEVDRGELVLDFKTRDPFQVLRDSNNKEVLKEYVNSLKSPMGDILIYRFGLNGNREHTLRETTAKIGLGRERVRQLQSHALYKIQSLFERDYSKYFFEV